MDHQRPSSDSADLSSQGILGQRASIVRAVQVASHLYLLIRARAAGDRRRSVAAATAVSIAADLALAGWLDGHGRDPRWARTSADTAAAHLWARFVAPGDVLAARAVQIVTAVPHAIERGFRLRAGTVAVPVISNTEPYPPQGRGAWSRQLGAAVGSVTGPVLGAAATYYRRRQPLELNQVGWGAMALGLGGLLAQRREAFQERIKADWHRRTAPWLALERVAARVRVATASSQGHDFKKTLAALGQLGSASALEAAREQGDHPHVVLEHATDGATMWDVCHDLAVWPEPPSSWTTWLTDEQIDQLGRLVTAANADLGPGIDDEVTLQVGAISGRGVQVRYRGRTASLVHSRPTAHARLDPVGLSLLLGGAWKALTPMMAGVEALPAGLAALVDLAGFAVYASSPPDQDEATRVLGLAVGSTAILDAAIALGKSRETGASGEVAFGATPATQGLLFVIGRYGGALGRRGWWLTAGAFGLWGLGAARTAKRYPAAALAELCFLGMITGATVGLDERIEFEARLLEKRLDTTLDDDLDQARRTGAEQELERFQRHLALAEVELARLDAKAEPGMVDVFDRLRQDCDALRTWLKDPDLPRWLAM